MYFILRSRTNRNIKTFLLGMRIVTHYVLELLQLASLILLQEKSIDLFCPTAILPHLILISHIFGIL